MASQEITVRRHEVPWQDLPHAEYSAFATFDKLGIARRFQPRSITRVAELQCMGIEVGYDAGGSYL